MGTSEKPSKIEWLMENGGKSIDGVQIISLASDMLPKNLLNYHEKLLALVEKFPFLERVSVALLCWPLVKDDGGRGGVAASTFLSADLFFYALGVCRALQKVHDQTGIQVDISYHPMLTWPSSDAGSIDDAIWHQWMLWEWETKGRDIFSQFLSRYTHNSVGVNIENEPVTSDQYGNLTHTGNRLFTEQIFGLFRTWGVTADLQHCGMMLQCLEKKLHLNFPPFQVSGSLNPNQWSWPAQFRALHDVTGDITFHVAQVEDPLRHITPPIRWDDPIMDWPLILRLMQELDEDKGGEVWYAVEIDGGHLYPQGYQHDLDALLHLQEYFGK